LPGTYEESVILNVTGKALMIKGDGSSSTTISGDVTISSDDNTLEDLRISGDVTINSDNNTLENLRITGDLTVNGDNNDLSSGVTVDGSVNNTGSQNSGV
jgi:hypothetical protein